MIKLIHVSSALISITLFVLRGLAQFAGAAWLAWRGWRIVPHVNDSLLLISAIILVISSRQYPFVDNWLTAKLIALVVYIVLGMTAMKWGRTRRQRLLAWCMAVAVFGYIVVVAMSRNPSALLF